MVQTPLWAPEWLAGLAPVNRFSFAFKLISPREYPRKSFIFSAPIGATVPQSSKRGRNADGRGSTTKDLFMEKFPTGAFASSDSISMKLKRLFGLTDTAILSFLAPPVAAVSA
ncbi:hypothetical protein M885DRAFT_564273 [Pelagophyceae sp. CCMP2097]|nr:hypothetical protein M885DRAFT_564273 [Pelagophyceae sp. CCMP2097]